MINSVLSHNLVSNGLISMNLKFSIYNHGVVIQVMFLQDVLSNRGVTTLWFSESSGYIWQWGDNSHKVWSECLRKTSVVEDLLPFDRLTVNALFSFRT